jgi:flavin-dependent dehydrogenase
MIDVLIAGGGVGGCAAAIRLGRLGFSVAVLDVPRQARHQVGETLGPSIRPLLADLRLWDQFLSDGHTRCYGMRSAWGQTELYSNDFVAHPHGSGWHIDRVRFDAMLARAARDAGAVFYPDAPPDGMEETASGWKVSVRSAAGPFDLNARFLVDSTGRSACVARRLGAQRIALDRGVAVARCYSLPPGQAGPDSFTLVESSQDGWWYSSFLPSGQVVALYFTDPEFRLRAELPPHTAARVRGGQCASGPAVYPGSSSYLNRIAGRKWLALGDAACTWDPLSSQGIAKALRSSLAAAAAIAGHFAGDANAVRDYGAQARDNFRRYAQVRQYYYRREQRWPASLFWKRRQASHALLSARASSPGPE